MKKKKKKKGNEKRFLFIYFICIESIKIEFSRLEFYCLLIFFFK